MYLWTLTCRRPGHWWTVLSVQASGTFSQLPGVLVGDRMARDRRRAERCVRRRRRRLKETRR